MMKSFRTKKHLHFKIQKQPGTQKANRIRESDISFQNKQTNDRKGSIINVTGAGAGEKKTKKKE